MKKIFLSLILMASVFTMSAQTGFSNGPNVITITAAADDSTFTDAHYTFTFARDVETWGLTVSPDSVISGSATITLQVSNTNLDNDSTWVDYPDISAIAIDSTNRTAIWQDTKWCFRYGRYVFTSTDLYYGTVIIINYAKTK